MFKDHNCTCGGYCCCDFPMPCSCKGMAKDPHCALCLQHLSRGQERAWRENMAANGIDLDKWEDQWDEDSDLAQ